MLTGIKIAASLWTGSLFHLCQRLLNLKYVNRRFFKWLQATNLFSMACFSFRVVFSKAICSLFENRCFLASNALTKMVMTSAT